MVDGNGKEIVDGLPNDPPSPIKPIVDNTAPIVDKDTNGNPIIKPIEPVKTPEQIEAERLAAEEVKNNPPADVEETVIFEQDGVEKTYKISKEGNVLNDDGSIFKTKSEYEQLLSDNEPKDALDVKIEDVAKLSGIQLIDTNGEPLSFEPTIEGFARRETAIAEQYANTGYQQALDDLYSQNPEIPELLKHKRLYGNLENFGKTIDYSNMTIDKDKKELHKNLIIEAEVLRGRTVEAANKLADYYIADGSSFDEAKVAQSFLSEHKAKEDAARNKVIQDQQDAIREQAEQYYGVKLENNKVVPSNDEGTVFDMLVRKGQIGKFKIPETGVTIDINGKTQKLSRADLFNYIAIPNAETGYTQAQLNEKNYLNDKGNYILHHLRILMGYNFNQIITDAVGEQHLKEVKRIKLKPTVTNVATGNEKAKLPYQ